MLRSISNRLPKSKYYALSHNIAQLLRSMSNSRQKSNDYVILARSPPGGKPPERNITISWYHQPEGSDNDQRSIDFNVMQALHIYIHRLLCGC